MTTGGRRIESLFIPETQPGISKRMVVGLIDTRIFCQVTFMYLAKYHVYLNFLIILL